MEESQRAIIPRMVGAAVLDVATYEEVEHDSGATGQAAAVVVMAAVAQAFGAAGGGIVVAMGSALAALVGWGVWAGITYLVGDRLFDGTATWGELLRTLGFAQAPGLLAIVGILPLMGVVTWIIPLWMLVTGFVAIRQALDFGNAKTFLTIIVGWVPYALLTILF